MIQGFSGLDYNQVANTYLKIIYNNLTSTPFKSFDEFVNEVFRDRVDGIVYLEDRAALGQAISNYLSIIYKTKAGLEAKFKALAKAAGPTMFPSKSAIWTMLSKDVSSVKASEFIRIGTKAVAETAKATGNVAVEVGSAVKTGLTTVLNNLPVILGIAALLGGATLYYKIKKTKQAIFG